MADRQTGSTEPIPGRCGSPLRNKPGRFCTRWPLKDRERCRLHGGASPRGPEHPNWKHGMYSTVLPAGLRERYQRTRTNPDLVASTEQIALIDARIEELFVDGESPQIVRRLKALVKTGREAFEEFGAARRAANGVALAAAVKRWDETMSGLEKLVADGAQALALWDEVKDLMILRRKAVDSEVRRQKAAHDVLTSEQALAFRAAVSHSVVRLAAQHIKDPITRAAFLRAHTDDMRLLLSGGHAVIEGQVVAS